MTLMIRGMPPDRSWINTTASRVNSFAASPPAVLMRDAI
jgi:hypothetical protein